MRRNSPDYGAEGFQQGVEAVLVLVRTKAACVSSGGAMEAREICFLREAPSCCCTHGSDSEAGGVAMPSRVPSFDAGHGNRACVCNVGHRGVEGDVPRKGGALLPLQARS